MRETKAFASLTSGLLARKGQARPAMRAQSFGFGTAKLDDLGWNDMGEDLSVPMADFGRSDESPVQRQQDKIAQALAVPLPTPAAITPPVLAPVVDLRAPVVETVAASPLPHAKRARSVKTKPAAPAGPVTAAHVAARRAAFTLRIDAERHLRLRLACAVQGRSAQQIVTAALDSFLADLPDVERLAASLSASRGGRD